MIKNERCEKRKMKKWKITQRIQPEDGHNQKILWHPKKCDPILNMTTTKKEIAQNRTLSKLEDDLKKENNWNRRCPEIEEKNMIKNEDGQKVTGYGIWQKMENEQKR